MTISSETRKAGPFPGNGTTTVFPFGFKVFAKTDLKLLLINTAGTSTPLTLDSDYSISLNGDQNANPGGTITYPLSGSPMLSGFQLVGIGDVPNLQPTDITNTGGFYPQVVEDMSDRSTIQIQQLAELAGRAIVVSESESYSPVLPGAAARAGQVLGFDVLGNVTLLPLPSTLGGGNLTIEGPFIAGADFTPGTSNSVTLSKAYGSKANLGTVVMAGVPQAPDTYALSGNTLTFNAVIPVGTDKIWCIGGSTLSIYTPPVGSVGDAQLAWGTTLTRTVPSIAALGLLNPIVYQRAMVTGYYTTGDGGGGEYWYDSTANPALADGGALIAAYGGVGGWRLRLMGRPSLKQWGAYGDDVHDDAPAFNAATAWCIANGKTLYVPSTQAAYRLNTPVVFGGNIAIEGDGVHAYTSTGTIAISTVVIGPGSWFHINHAGIGFSATGVTNQPFATVYRGIGTIRNQPTPNGAAPWGANANDYDFYNNNADLYMDDVFCLNPTKFSYTTGGSRAWYRKIRGQPLQQGIYTDTAYDVCRYDNIHFWPWWSQASAVGAYTRTNATAFTFARNDNPQMSNVFAIWYNMGLRIISNANGQTQRLKIDNMDFDGAVYGIVIQGGATAVTAHINNLSVTGNDATSACGVFMDNTAVNCTVWLSGAYLANLGQSGVLLQGTNCQAYIGDRCFVQQWSMGSAGNPAFGAAAGNTIQFDAIPEVALPQNGALMLSSAGNFKGTLYRAHFGGNTNASGQFGFSHNLGYNAVNIAATVTQGSPALTVQAAASSTTAVTLQFYNGTTAYANAGISCSVTIMGD